MGQLQSRGIQPLGRQHQVPGGAVLGLQVRGTAEEEPFSMDQLQGILATASKAMEGVYKAQDQALS